MSAAQVQSALSEAYDVLIHPKRRLLSALGFGPGTADRALGWSREAAAPMFDTVHPPYLALDPDPLTPFHDAVLPSGEPLWTPIYRNPTRRGDREPERVLQRIGTGSPVEMHLALIAVLTARSVADSLDALEWPERRQLSAEAAAYRSYADDLEQIHIPAAGKAFASQLMRMVADAPPPPKSRAAGQWPRRVPVDFAR